jgi:hypothetical protein
LISYQLYNSEIPFQFLGGCRSGCKIIIYTSAFLSSRRHRVFRLYSAASVPTALRGITAPTGAGFDQILQSEILLIKDKNELNLKAIHNL